jgi:mannose-6-phosphate isomerase-like protein (cupin superfamily)
MTERPQARASAGVGLRGRRAARDKPLVRRATSLALAVVLAVGCARRPPRIPFVDDVPAFLATHPLAAGQNIRVDEIGRTVTASYHLVQVRDRETPHRHAAHDLAVVVLRGRGMLVRPGGSARLRAGDVVVVPRGEPHWFANGRRAPAVALVAFAPPLDAPDSVPADVR